MRPIVRWKLAGSVGDESFGDDDEEDEDEEEEEPRDWRLRRCRAPMSDSKPSSWGQSGLRGHEQDELTTTARRRAGPAIGTISACCCTPTAAAAAPSAPSQPATTALPTTCS